ncbi:hypothetical protein [Streptomyces hydrogenans]
MSSSKGPVSQVPMLISLRMVARILASETDNTTTGEQDPFTDKAEACAAAFRDSGVSGQCQAGDGGVAIAVDADRDDVEAGQVVLADGFESLGSRSSCRSVSMWAKDRT